MAITKKNVEKTHLELVLPHNPHIKRVLGFCGLAFLLSFLSTTHVPLPGAFLWPKKVWVCPLALAKVIKPD